MISASSAVNFVMVCTQFNNRRPLLSHYVKLFTRLIDFLGLLSHLRAVKRVVTHYNNIQLQSLIFIMLFFRLEAGLCLYGNDIWEDTTPVEAALTWLVAKRRRELANFPGAQVILDQIKNGVNRKRVGLIASSGPPARHNAPIFDEKGEKLLGEVTSGCPSPTLGRNIAMGYVPNEFTKIDTKLKIKIRDKLYEAVVAKMPFVKANYYNKPKN